MWRYKLLSSNRFCSMLSCYRFVAAVVAVLLFAQISHAQVTFDRSLVWSRPGDRHVDFTLPSFPTSGPARILAIDTSLKSRILANLKAVYNAANPEGRHGVAGSVIAPRLGQITFSIGENFDGAAMNDSLAFEIGSNTKTFVAALILKLQEEGKLSIKDSLKKWLPTYPNIDSTITIKQLLEHSSGIYDYLNDDPSNVIINQAYAYDPEHVWTPEEILTSHVGAPNFKPGKSYRYSNTNFLLLGMIAAKATGMTAAQAIHHYFLDPLAIGHVVPAWEDSVHDVVAHQWFPIGQYPSEDFSDIPKTAQLTSAHTAGGIIATVADLAKWSNTFYTGQLLSANSMKQMETWHTWSNGMVYGLGAMKLPYYTHSFVGHGGHLLGFSSDMATNPTDSVTFVIYTNYDVLDSDKSLNDYALAVLDAVYAPAASVSVGTERSVTVSAWPNPTSSLVMFSSTSPAALHYVLTDDLGRQVAKANADAGTDAIVNVSGLPSGTYHYSATSASGQTSGSILVRH